MGGEFINPYNFVSIDEEYCLKEKFIDFKKFHDGYLSGRLVCRIKSVDDIPIFIPDTGKEEYAILLKDIPLEDVTMKNLNPNKEYLFRLSDKRLEVIEEEPTIPDNLSNIEEIKKAINESFSIVKGKIRKIRVDLKSKEIYAIITDDPKSFRDKSHRILYFCMEPSGKPMIPSTSIKGMIRTIVEAVSNSCMAHVEDKQIFYRLNPNDSQKEIGDLSKGTYIVIKKDENGATLLKLNSAKVTTDFILEDELKKSSGSDAYAVIVKNSSGVFKYIKRIGKKSAMDKCCEMFQEYLNINGINKTCEVISLNNKNTKILSNDKYHVKAEITINGTSKEYLEPRLLDKDAKKIYALINKKVIRGFPKYYVKDIHADRSVLKKKKRKKFSLVEAWVKRSGDIDTKSQDTLFFKYGQNDLMGYINKVRELLQRNPSDPSLQEDILNIKYDIVRSYEQILKDRKENLNNNPKEPDSLNEGDLVYYNSKEEYLSYTQIPRKKYKYSTGNLIRNKACNQLNSLCPACSIFGTAETEEKGRKSAISGKVFFGRGKLTSKSHTLESHVPLKILSSPKPSCKEFYLIPGGNYDNENSRIRGRKFYYHHSQNHLYYRMIEGDFKDNEIINTQNVSIEVLKKHFIFEFTVDFMNLSPYELGLLLFALDLKDNNDKKMYHKIGMGKPLGLGTVEIEIDIERSFLINRKKRYLELFSDGKENLKIKEYINIFKNKQLETYNHKSNNKINDFYKIPYISDLFNILYVNTINSGYDDIKYPRKTKCGEPRGFQWFVEEIKKKKPPQTLPTPQEVKEKTKKLTGWS